MDMTGEEYSEDSHIPGGHVFFTYPSSLQTSSMTPMLISKWGVQIDSTEIIKLLSSKYPDTLGNLYFTDDNNANGNGKGGERRGKGGEEKEWEEWGVEEWEEYLDQEIGVPTRRLAYSFFLPHPVGKQLMIAEVALIERLLIHLIFPLVSMKIRRALDIPTNTQSQLQCDDQIMAAYRRVEERMEDGRKYLCGNHFTAADLTLAALSYPLLFPDEYAHRLPPISVLPDAFVVLMKKYRTTVAGKHAMKMYAQHRFPSSLPGPRYVTALRYVNPFLRDLPFFLFSLSLLLFLFFYFFYF